MKPSSSSELFAQANHTELYQICRRLGLDVPPSTSRDVMMGYLTGEIEVPPDLSNVIDDWRLAIMSFVLDHWQVIRSQLECPAKSGDPRACFNCVDAQVISCIVQNAENEPLIQVKRKKP